MLCLLWLCGVEYRCVSVCDRCTLILRIRKCRNFGGSTQGRARRALQVSVNVHRGHMELVRARYVRHVRRRRHAQHVLRNIHGRGMMAHAMGHILTIADHITISTIVDSIDHLWRVERVFWIIHSLIYSNALTNHFYVTLGPLEGLLTIVERRTVVCRCVLSFAPLHHLSFPSLLNY